MKKTKLGLMLASATLFVTLGALNANASEMKCGAGKCGASMNEKPAKKCGMGKCGGKKADKKASKCGAQKQEKKKMMKCGAGKCGGN